MTGPGASSAGSPRGVHFVMPTQTSQVTFSPSQDDPWLSRRKVWRPTMDDTELAKELALLPQDLTDKIQEELDRIAPGEFEVIRAPDGALAIVEKSDGND